MLIDTGPDFHAQALREDVTRVDAVLYTHSHADHILGMDDLRPLSFKNVEPMPLYADEGTTKTIERIFDYTFNPANRYPTSARVKMQALGDGVELFGACFRRIPVMHGRQEISGYRFGGAAYLTDMSDLSEQSLGMLEGLDVLILDALRREPHPTHSHLARSIGFVERLTPKRAFFTHISHDLEHEATNADLPEHIRLAYDGLQVEFEISA